MNTEQHTLLHLNKVKLKAQKLVWKRIGCKIEDKEFDMETNKLIGEAMLIELEPVIPNSIKCLKVSPQVLIRLSQNKTHLYKIIIDILHSLSSMSSFQVSFDKRKGVIHLFDKSTLMDLYEKKESNKETNKVTLTDKQISNLIKLLFTRKKYFNNRIRGINQKLRHKIYKRDNYTCVLCGAKPPLHIDHIIPVNLGGNNNPNNLQTLCIRCNLKKSDKF